MVQPDITTRRGTGTKNRTGHGLPLQTFLHVRGSSTNTGITRNTTLIMKDREEILIGLATYYKSQEELERRMEMEMIDEEADFSGACGTNDR